MIISEELRDALCEQYSHEKYNANFYLVIAAFLKNKGLNGLSKLFEHQHEEEVSHSFLIYEFVTDMNANFISPQVDKIEFSIGSIIDIAEKYLEREVSTTKSLEEIKQLCIDDGNGVAEEFLRQMVDKQRNELKEALDFKDNAELCGGNWMNVKIWSDSLGD